MAGQIGHLIQILYLATTTFTKSFTINSSRTALLCSHIQPTPYPTHASKRDKSRRTEAITLTTIPSHLIVPITLNHQSHPSTSLPSTRRTRSGSRQPHLPLLILHHEVLEVDLSLNRAAVAHRSPIIHILRHGISASRNENPQRLHVAPRT